VVRQRFGNLVAAGHDIPVHNHRGQSTFKSLPASSQLASPMRPQFSGLFFLGHPDIKTPSIFGDGLQCFWAYSLSIFESGDNALDFFFPKACQTWPGIPASFLKSRPG
jgi:hypothetical protein